MKKLYLLTLVVFSLNVSCISNADSTSTKRKCKEQSSTITTPAEAIAALKAGNERYVKGEMAHPNSDAARRASTVGSQSPYAVVVACSDSRVPVEVLFDQGIGDIFVIRTAGNSVSEDVVMGSLDYAVDHLDTPLVVILGHQNCGGISSAIAPHGDDDHHHNGKIGELLTILREDVEQYVGHPEQLDEAIYTNATAQVDRVKEVDYIKEKIKAGKLEVVSAYYNIDNGKVTFAE